MSERDPIREAHRQWVGHGWDAAADGMAMVTSLTRAHQLLMERVDTVLRPLDLSFARYEVLMLLSFTRRRALPMSRIGTLLQVHPTSATSAVDRLERQGFVRRERDEHDRRVVLACLTPQGRRAAQGATRRLNQQVFERPGLEPDGVRALTRLLGEVRADAGDAVDFP